MINNITLNIKVRPNPVTVVFDQPDYRDDYESFDFWNCEVFKVVDTETKEDISSLLNYDDYREIFDKLFKELDKN